MFETTTLHCAYYSLMLHQNNQHDVNILHFFRGKILLIVAYMSTSYLERAKEGREAKRD